METGAFRELLTADVAVELGLLGAAEAGDALAQFWETRKESLAARLDPEARAKVEAEVARILLEAGGDLQAAVARRGVDRELPLSLAPEASHALSDAGARLRAPLRAMDRKRYVGFLPLGQGGMGVVYLALDSELNRRVAFKMIRSGATDPLAEKSGPIPDDMVARFMQEAVVTGGLEHPGIVPVYELGITPSGVPYYTMRLVRGEKTLQDAIHAADAAGDRLALLEPFLKVCDAVGYAHSRGVIHRDLKPANIALGQFGEVVVLDWGLAKMQERPDLAGSRWQTRLDELRNVTNLETLTSALGTPGYMAPEAAFGEIDKIDKRSDIYSLGAILHRILTGSFPFDFSTFQEYVAKLSRGLAKLPQPEGLGRICERALAPRREDRYGGVGELAAAIRAWQNESAIDREIEVLLTEARSALAAAEALEGDEQLRQLDRTIAVAARIHALRASEDRAAALRDSARDLRSRAMSQREAQARGRLMRRVGAIGLLVATAATVVVAFLLNARREEAELARARAEDLAGFMLNDLHEGLVPVGRLDLLAKVARKSLDYYTGLPREAVTDKERRARALVLGRIGEVLHDSGDMKGALESCLQSQRLYEALSADGNAEYELSTALNRTGDAQQELNDLDGALESYGRSAELRRKLGREAELTRSLDRTAKVLMRRGEREPAMALHAECLRIRRKLYETDPECRLRQRDLALSLEAWGELEIADLAKARATFLEALGILRRSLAAAPADAQCQADVATCLFRVAHCQVAMGEREDGTRSYEEALALYRSLAEADPSNVWNQRNLAMTLERLRRFGEALEVKRRLLEHNATNPRMRHDLIGALMNVGDAAHGKAEHAAARKLLEEALSMARELVGEDDSNTEWKQDLGDALYRVGQVDAATGRSDEARRHFVESLAVARELAEKDPGNGDWQRTHALALERLERYAESIPIWRALVERNPSHRRWRLDLVHALSVLGDRTNNIDPYEEAVKAHRAFSPDPSQQRELAYCLYRVGTMREAKEEWEPALLALREAEEVHRATPGYEEEHHWWADAYFRASYDAACAAAKAGDSKLAFRYLSQHLAWSRAHLEKARLASHLDHAREGDADLESIRGTPEFDALFR